MRVVTIVCTDACSVCFGKEVKLISLELYWNQKCFIKSCGEKLNTHFMFNNIAPPPPPKNRDVCERMWEYYCRAGHATDDSMMYVHSMLDTKGYRQSLRICNTYCFSTTTMVTQTTPQCYIIHALPVL
jgi:hypothetical protein